MKNICRCYLSLALAIIMFVPMTALAAESKSTDPFVEAEVIYENKEVLTSEEVNYRIQEGITDVTEEALPIEVEDMMQGEAKGLTSKYLGSTTQLKKKSVAVDGNIISQYETTAVFEINDTLQSDSDYTPYIIAPSGSLSVYCTVMYSSTTDAAKIYYGRIDDIHTYYVRHDAVLPVTKVAIYETSVGRMLNGTTNLGVLTLNRYLAYANNPTTANVYFLSNCTKVNSLTKYWVAWGGFGASHNLSTKIQYTVRSHDGSLVNYNMYVKVFNDGSIMEGWL